MPSFTSTNPVLVNRATKVEHYDVVFDNTLVLRAGGIAVASQAVGDLFYATSATQMGRLAAVAVGQVLVSAGTGTAPAWSGSPSLTSVLATSVIVPAASGRVYLDGGADTYWYEPSGNNAALVVGGSTRINVTTDAYIQCDVRIPAGNRFYLDGGSNTYLLESSADTLSAICGGTTALTLTASSVTANAGTWQMGTSANNGVRWRLLGGSSLRNWQIGHADFGTGQELEFTPSTANGGSTFTTPVMTLNALTGAVVLPGGTLTLGESGVTNSVINALESMYLNIDSNNDQTDRDFRWGKDRSSTSGGTTLAILAEGGNFTLSLGALIIQSGQKFYPDGGGDTYIYESAANTLTFVVGGATALTLTSGGWAAGDGSAAAPAYSFASDTDTGFYRTTSDAMGVSFGGVQKMALNGVVSGVGPALILLGGAHGTGGASGAYIAMERNTSGGGAPGAIAMHDKGGTLRWLWVDTSGKLRVGTSQPTEVAGDTGGTIVGTQS